VFATWKMWWRDLLGSTNGRNRLQAPENPRLTSAQLKSPAG
jgi:hypothetical protein